MTTLVMEPIIEKWVAFEKEFKEFKELVSAPTRPLTLEETQSLQRIDELHDLCVYTGSRLTTDWGRFLGQKGHFGHKVRWIETCFQALDDSAGALPVPAEYLSKWKKVSDCWSRACGAIYGSRYGNGIQFTRYTKCDNQPWTAKEFRTLRLRGRAQTFTGM